MNMFNLNLEIMAITEKIYESFAMFISMNNKEGRKLVDLIVRFNSEEKNYTFVNNRTTLELIN